MPLSTSGKGLWAERQITTSGQTTRQTTLGGMNMQKNDYEPLTILPIRHALTMTQSPTFSMGWPVECPKTHLGVACYRFTYGSPSLPSNFTFKNISQFQYCAYIIIFDPELWALDKIERQAVFRGSRVATGKDWKSTKFCPEFMCEFPANIPALREVPPNFSSTFDACSFSTGPTKKLLTINLGRGTYQTDRLSCPNIPPNHTSPEHRWPYGLK